jgi:hypothetical protein
MHGPRPVTMADADQHLAPPGTPDREHRPWSLMVVLSVAQFMVILGVWGAIGGLGAALGVAVFSAVAVAVGGGIAAGYRHGFMLAAALAVAAALAIPTVRPAAGTRVAVH